MNSDDSNSGPPRGVEIRGVGEGGRGRGGGRGEKGSGMTSLDERVNRRLHRRGRRRVYKRGGGRRDNVTGGC